MRPEALEFLPGDLSPVLTRMADLAERREGWINLEPIVEDPEDDTPVPLCTWSPGEQKRRRATPPVVGIQHHVRRKVAEVVAVPDGWFVVQDHGRRGLVVRVPADAPHEQVLRWLLSAAETLCPVPVGRWAAQVYGPSAGMVG